MSVQTDDRQILNRAVLQQLFPWIGSQGLDILMSSISQDLTPPFKMDATSTPSLTINIGPSTVTNTVSGRNKAASFLGTALPNFAGGTVTFPSASGGNITTSTGGSIPLTLPVGDYVQVLLAIDESNDLNVAVGTPNAVLASATVPPPQASTQPFGYVTVQNIGGVIQNITQENIYYFAGSGSGSSGGSGGVAQEVALTAGTTSQTVTFPTPQSSNNYSIVGSIYNPTDPNPEFFPIIVSNKTNATATFEWNQPLDTNDYFLDYSINPGLSTQAGEMIVPMGATSVVITMPLPIGTTSYIVNAEMTDYSDSYPQFQPVTITQKTGSTFTVSWNTPTETANVAIVWQLAAYT